MIADSRRVVQNHLLRNCYMSLASDLEADEWYGNRIAGW